MAETDNNISNVEKTSNPRTSTCGSAIKLKRELGLFSAVNLILGVMIGSGIFVSPATALQYSGSVGLCLIVWTVSGVISLLGALSFAELGTVLGKSGAEYSYFKEAFGKTHKYWGPLPSFICAWIYVMILRPAEVAIIVMTFAEYAIQPFTTDIQQDYKNTAIKLASLVALSGGNMSDSINAQTKANLSKNIQHLHEKCVDVFNIITNAPLDDGILPENVGEKALCYVEGLRTSIQNANTDVINDENLILNEFLAESKERQVQIKELKAFTRGAIFEIEDEIKRLKNITQISEEALSRPRVVQNEILSEHIHKARSTFQTMKSELLGVVQSIFPNDSEAILDIIRQLNQEKTNQESNGYIPITHESFWMFEFLKDMKIVSLNPYNNMEAKLAY